MPSIVHATELTQPLGHSTSGSQERYKSKARLEWEAEFDCLKKFREWIIAQGLASSAELEQMEAEDLQTVEESAPPGLGSLYPADRAGARGSCRVDRRAG